MKRIIGFFLCIAMLAAITSLSTALAVTATDTDILVPENPSPQFSLLENTELILNFDVIGENGSLSILLYDMDASTTNDIRSDAPNFLTLRHSSCYLANKNPDKKIRWSSQIDKTGDYINKVDDNHVANQILPEGNGYVLKLNRWKDRISVTITGPDDTVYWDVVYKAKTDMAETIYCQLSPYIMSIRITEYTFGETESVKETNRSSGEAAFIIAIIAGLAVLVGLNIGSTIVSKTLFPRTGFGFLTGGLWAAALITSISIVIPPLRDLYGKFIGFLVGLDSAPLTGLGVWMWIIFAVCAALSVIYFIVVLKNSSVNPALTVLLLLFFGAVYLFTFCLIVALLFKTVLLGVLIFCAFIASGCIRGGNRGGEHETSIYSSSSGESSLPNTLWGDGSPFRVSHGGGDYLYIYPSNGDNRNAIRVQKTSSGLFVDEYGNYYNI